MARCFGLEVQVSAPERGAGALAAAVDRRTCVGAVFLPNDGQTNPIDTTQALARGARSGGVRIFEDIARHRHPDRAAARVRGS